MVNFEEAKKNICFETKNIKIKIINEIEEVGKKYISLSHILNSINDLRNLCKYYSSRNSLDNDIKELLSKSNVILLNFLNEVQKKMILSKSKLSIIIKKIITSKRLKEILDIKGCLDTEEINLLISDISESLSVLTFYKDENIAKYILSYIQKFIKYNN